MAPLFASIAVKKRCLLVALNAEIRRLAGEQNPGCNRDHPRPGRSKPRHVFHTVTRSTTRFWRIGRQRAASVPRGVARPARTHQDRREKGKAERLRNEPISRVKVLVRYPEAPVPQGVEAGYKVLEPPKGGFKVLNPVLLLHICDLFCVCDGFNSRVSNACELWR
jgi:hypothetical protein